MAEKPKILYNAIDWEAVKDQMTPLERTAAWNAGKATDRLPCIPVVGRSGIR